MKIQFFFLFACLLGVLFSSSSCRTHGPAFSANADTYIPKPVYRGENEGALYFSGRINKGYTYYEAEKNNSFDLGVNAAYSMEYAYVAGGIFGFWGNYDVNSAVSPVTGGGKQPFSGAGIRMELGARIPIQRNVDLLAGINSEMFREGGKYTENSESAFEDIFTLGLNHVVVNAAPSLDLRVHPTKKWSLGLRYTYDSYVSVSDLYGESKNSYLHRLTLHTTLDKATLFGQLGFTPDQQRVFSVGLAYGIPFKKKEKTEKS